MKKILILGCSYSDGHWVPLEYSPFEKTYYDKGWYNYVDCFNNCKIDVIATGSLGIVAHAQILHVLYDHNKFDYDHIVIQETFEPRISFTNDIDILTNLHFKQSVNINDNIRIINFNADETKNLFFKPITTDCNVWLDEMSPKKQIKFLKTFMYNSLLVDYHFLVNGAYKSIENKFDITDLRKFLLISFGKKNYSGNKLLHTKLTDLYDLAIEENLITYNKPHIKNEQQIGHPTDEGNKLIGSVINEKLKYYVT